MEGFELLEAEASSPEKLWFYLQAQVVKISKNEGLHSLREREEDEKSTEEVDMRIAAVEDEVWQKLFYVIDWSLVADFEVIKLLLG